MTGREKIKLLTDFYNATHIVKLQNYNGEDAAAALLEMKSIMKSMNMAGLRVPDPINTNWLQVGHGKVHKDYGTVVCICPHGYSYVLNDTRYNVLQLDFENVMCDCAQNGLDRFFEVLKDGELKDGAELMKSNLILRPADDFKFPPAEITEPNFAELALAILLMYNSSHQSPFVYYGGTKPDTISKEDQFYIMSSIPYQQDKVHVDVARALRDRDTIAADKDHLIVCTGSNGNARVHKLTYADEFDVTFVSIGNSIVHNSISELNHYVWKIVEKAGLITA